MHKVTFFPLGNADTCLVALECGMKLLFDYAHWKDSEDEEDLRIDLATELRRDLDENDRDYYDVVAFTHADDDHIHGASEFFFLEHAKKYQDEDRVKINELWIPAAMIIEEGLEDDAAILREEARYRLKKGQGIRVFSRPERLKKWLENQGLGLKDRLHLITNAGSIIPGISKENEGIEFFVHSPFSLVCDEEEVDRNEASLVLQGTFKISGTETKILLTADTTHDIWADIVNITKNKKNDCRLDWDILKIPHHCSYKSLSNEKGEEKTEPIEEVKWLLDRGQDRAIIVSTSNPIPNNDENEQPPHRQAANCYKDYTNKLDGEFVVTMEHPDKSKPDKLIIEIDSNKARLKKSIIVGGAAAVHRPAPRAGCNERFV